MKKRVMILANYDMGLYKFRRELIVRLCDEYDVIICVPPGEYGSRLKELGARVVNCTMERRGMNPFHELALLNRYKQVLKEERPDVVLTYTIKPNVYGGMACKSKRIPYIPNVTGLGTTIENGGLISKLSLSLYKAGLSKASCVFFQNETNRRMFTDKGIVKGKTKVIPGSGVNLNDHPLEVFPPIEDAVRFLFIGRIMRDKGIQELLDAIKEIKHKGFNVSLDIVGEFDGDYESAIREAEKTGYIKFHGLQSNVHPFIKNAHCVVLPSYHEGMANVMLEAASTGRPVITTTVPGCRETFDEGVTGFGCEAQNTQSLISAMEHFLNLSTIQMTEMGLAGRVKVEKEFDRNIVISSYLDQIQSAINA